MLSEEYSYCEQRVAGLTRDLQRLRKLEERLGSKASLAFWHREITKLRHQRSEYQSWIDQWKRERKNR